MLLDLIDLSKLRRAIVYGLLFLALFILQDLIVSHVRLFGIRPMIVPAAVVAIGIFEGGIWGGLLGLAAGYFTDMGLAGHVVLFTILLPAVGFLTGALGKYMLNKGFVSFLSMTLLALALIALCQMVPQLLFLDDDGRAFRALYAGVWPVWRTGLIQTAWSLVWSMPVYFPCKLIAARPMGR